MNTTSLIRLAAGPVAAASIMGGALGLAAVANASTSGTSFHPHTVTGMSVGHEQQKPVGTVGGNGGHGAPHHTLIASTGRTARGTQDDPSGNTQGGTQGPDDGNTQGGTQGPDDGNTQGGTQGAAFESGHHR